MTAVTPNPERGRIVRVAIVLVRAWTVVYTWGLPPADRERRLGEVECDLWESEVDAHPGSMLSLHIMSRLILGVADDLLWRLEHTAARAATSRRLALTVGALAILGYAWAALVITRADPPRPPQAPELAWRYGNGRAPAPPPPPPPPCNPPGIGRAPFSPCTPIGGRQVR